MGHWTWDWAIRNAVAELLLPPGLWVLLILLALFAFRRRPRLQAVLITLSAIMIWVCSTKAFYWQLLNATEGFMHWPAPYVASTSVDPKAAIVILGGGRTKGAAEYPQYQNQDLAKETFMRVRLGAQLAKATGLPVLVTGGAPDQTLPQDRSEADVMAQIMKTELGVAVRWREGHSATTEENARFSQELLAAAGIHHIYLVTHQWHMPRAQRMFEDQKLVVTPVPMGFERDHDATPLDYYPSGTGFTAVRHVWHEVLGMGWYRLRH
jgi:uncharacterized SAM-binding protein YcdF (DUF218 family)